MFYVCLQVCQGGAFEETPDNPQQCGHFSMRDLWSQVQDQDKKSHRALGLVPDQPAQVGRPVQDQRILASKVDNQRSTVTHFVMKQKPVPDQKPFMMGEHKGMDRLVGLEGYKGSPME